MYYVYILQSGQHYYIGYTDNLKRRYTEHNSGKSAATKPYIPWNLVFYEAYTIQTDALRREKYLKTSQGKQALRRMLRDYFMHAEHVDKEVLD